MLSEFGVIIMLSSWSCRLGAQSMRLGWMCRRWKCNINNPSIVRRTGACIGCEWCMFDRMPMLPGCVAMPKMHSKMLTTEFGLNRIEYRRISRVSGSPLIHRPNVFKPSTVLINGQITTKFSASLWFESKSPPNGFRSWQQLHHIVIFVLALITSYISVA